MISAWPSRASCANYGGVPGKRSFEVCQMHEFGDGAGIGHSAQGFDGLVAEVGLREVLDRLGVSIAETVAAQERDELEFSAQVGFFVQMRPEGDGGLSLSIRRRASTA